MKGVAKLLQRQCARTLVVLGLLVLSVEFACASDERSHTKEYSFAIVPQQSAGKLARTWVPVLRYLSRKSGYKLRFETAKNIPTFEHNLGQQKFDFSYMNPYHYVVNHKNGYDAIAKAKDTLIRGILVVRRESMIHSLDDLNTRSIAFPSPNAFAASMIPRVYLKKQQIAFKPSYVISHDSVYRNVASGIFPAGGGVLRTFELTAPEVRSKLRILWTSEGFTPHAFTAHRRVPREVVESVIKAMVSMKDDENGRKLLGILKIHGIEKASDLNWNDIRKLPF